jgi:phage/plasmid-associated DNA primase
MTMEHVKTFAKAHNIAMSAVQCYPIFDEKKQRVSKGKTIPHMGWNKTDDTCTIKKRYVKSHVDHTSIGDTAKCWILQLRQSGFYVIDVDTKGDKKAEDVLFREAYDALYEKSQYIVRTGSGGLHFYFKIGEDHETVNFKTKTKSPHFNQCIEDREGGDIDILFDSVITEGSSYSFDNKHYNYQCIKGSINDVVHDSTVWEEIKKDCSFTNIADETSVYQSPSSNEELEEYVMNIPTKELSYQEWVTIAFAISNELGDKGKKLFETWSETYPQNNPSETAKLWRSTRQYKQLEHTTGTVRNVAMFHTIKNMSKRKNPEGHSVLEEKYDRFKECLIDLTTAKEERLREHTTVRSDKEAGDMIYEQLKARLMYSKKTLYFKVDNVWIDHYDMIESTIRNYVMNAKLYRLDKSNEPIIYSENITNARNITVVVIDNAMAHYNNQWELSTFDSSHGKVLFTNGYYDMIQGEFISSTSPAFDTSIVFFEHISYPFDETFANPSYADDIKRKLFTIPFGSEMGQFYILKLARATAGDGEKKFLAGIGSSNTGKSVITSALANTVGGYFGAWNGANLAYKNNSSQDEAQRLRWLYLLRHKRIIVSSELQVGGMGIDGNMIKKLSNGKKDPIVARLHGGNECDFKICFLPILFAQDLDRIRPIDDAVMNRIRAIKYEKIYVDEPSNELELKIDRGLDHEVTTNEFKMSFLMLLFDTYKTWVDDGKSEFEPDCVKHAVKDIVGTNVSIVDNFKEEYEITNDPEDYVTSSDVENWLKEGKFHVTMTKFGLELNRYCTIHKLDKVAVKVKKIKGKTVRCWMGIRQMTEDVEECNVVMNEF